jgi:hypothetical protein
VFQIPSPYFWDYTTLNFDSDVTMVDENFSSLFNSTNPDLSAFKRHGGKLIMYHGNADPLIPPANTINYYQSVASTQAVIPTDAFYRVGNLRDTAILPPFFGPRDVSLRRWSRGQYI